MVHNVHSQINVRREQGDDDPNTLNRMDKDSRFNYMDSMDGSQADDPNFPRSAKSERKNRISGGMAKIPECQSSYSESPKDSEDPPAN